MQYKMSRIERLDSFGGLDGMALSRNIHIGLGDVDVIERHDCFDANELHTFEALGCAILDAGVI